MSRLPWLVFPLAALVQGCVATAAVVQGDARLGLVALACAAHAVWMTWATWAYRPRRTPRAVRRDRVNDRPR